MVGVARGSGYPLSGDDHREMFRRYRAGESPVEIALGVGCAKTTVYNVFGKRLLLSRRVAQSELRLCFEERERISRGLAAGESGREIARVLGRSASTVSREVLANGGRDGYRAAKAQRRALECSARPKRSKLASCPRLRSAVENGLERRFSPQQISARLRIDHADDVEMRISPETIYQSLYVQGRGELRAQLAENLRTGRTRRKSRGGGPERRGRIRDMVLISERPAEVEDRAVPGHWEGDLIVGRNGKSFVATLVERQTRYVMLAWLGTDRRSGRVVDALKAQIKNLPDHLVKSLTWDQGTELSAHARFTAETDIQVYFCDPHSPWQRGSNENTNGLLRQYLPKGSDLAATSQTTLNKIAAELNGRPRETLGWMTPAEKLEALLR